ncbi:unnamed protein product [Kluyveromyces dobzhanskii CBS 2104]|uniref:WGS project CCBQ000000000 data, contig 00107 n=1 Tax=Kluyveromyces dobzhanskii CBS 2104 TaxID=1427455 RepID=A0A0A8KYY0_9SACH|nr:unnamed protein product [Kluyveromyces dobzhanskii CBS 2104]
MMVLYGVDVLIKDVIGITFPASVAVMLVNFVFLCVLSLINKELTEKIVGVIDVPLSWALRWMNLFFTPAFVTLPLSPWISFKEAMLIAASFVFMYIITGLCLAYVTIFGQKLVSLVAGRKAGKRGRGRGFGLLSNNKEEISGDMEENAFSSADEDVTEEESVLDIYEEDDDIHSFADIFSSPDVEDFQLVNVASNSGLPIQRTRTHTYTHSHSRDTFSASEAGALGDQTGPQATDDNTRLHVYDGETGEETSRRSSESSHLLLKPVQLLSRDASVMIPASSKSAFGHVFHNQCTDRNSGIECERAITRQFSQKMEHLFTVNMWHDHLHHILYGLGFFATIFTYYFSWYIMPFQLFTAICMFLIITDAPILPNPKYKKYMHPVICSVALFWIVELISTLIKHRQIKYFLSDLKEYKVGTTYLTLFTKTSTSGSISNKNWPGAGDVFSSCMDVSIVALSMPMYTYRRDLKKHFVVLLIPIFALCAATLMLNPLICYKIGISSYNSIGFVGRSITLALGMPTVENLDGSVTVMAVITVLSGIVGALSGGPMLDLFRVPRHDFVTRGLTLGCNCGAIATSYLLTVDRRAAAISSLSFVLYGAFMVILSSIGPVKDFVLQIVS